MISRAKIKARPANCQEDYTLIAELASNARTDFDPSGEPTALEDPELLKKAICYLGFVNHEIAGFLVLAVHVADKLIKDKKNTHVLTCYILPEYRGSKLFGLFHELSIELWKSSGDSSLVCVTSWNSHLSQAARLLGWKENAVELRYEGTAMFISPEPNETLPTQTSGIEIEPETPELTEDSDFIGL